MTAARTLSGAATTWIRHRNWSGSPDEPRLGALSVVARGSRFDVVQCIGNTSRILSTWDSPERAKRYVEHVHNFGRPPS